MYTNFGNYNSFDISDLFGVLNCTVRKSGTNCLSTKKPTSMLRAVPALALARIWFRRGLYIVLSNVDVSYLLAFNVLV